MTNNSSLKQLFTASTFSSSKTEVPLDLKSNNNSSFTISMIVIGAFIAFMATCLNLLIILTFAKTRSLGETPSNVLIIGLAISDLCVGVLAQPLFCVNLYGILKENYSLMTVSGKYNVFVVTLFCLASLFSLTAITVDRFLAVHLHLRYQELVTTKLYGITLACIWVTCLVWSVLRLMYLKGLRIALIFIMCGMILLNLSLILKIAKIIRRHSVQIQAQHQSVQLPSIDMPRYKKSVNTMYFVMAAFVLCYAPYIGQAFYFALLQSRNKETWEKNLIRTSALLMMLNSAINPIIYYWRIEEMRNASKRVIQGIWRQEENA